MKDIKYICGWCGIPCEEDGTPFDLKDIPKGFKPNRIDYENIPGSCCRGYYESQEDIDEY